ncbi:mCG144795, isoform CRA_b, partial [Mus musculus]
SHELIESFFLSMNDTADTVPHCGTKGSSLRLPTFLVPHTAYEQQSHQRLFPPLISGTLRTSSLIQDRLFHSRRSSSTVHVLLLTIVTRLHNRKCSSCLTGVSPPFPASSLHPSVLATSILRSAAVSSMLLNFKCK